MPEARKLLDRLQAGVPGLDAVLGGGAIRTAVYVVEGNPGAGKTILGNQICFANAARSERSVYFTLLTEAHDRMIGFVRQMSFYDQARVPNEVRYVSGFKTLESEGMPGVLRAIRDMVSSVRASVLVVDG